MTLQVWIWNTMVIDVKDTVLLLELLAEHQSRHLQSSNDDGNARPGDRSREILTISYLVVLALCFFLPVLYYIRLYFEERRLRRMHQFELEAYRNSFEDGRSGDDDDGLDNRNAHLQNIEAARAVRKKMREEKHARIIQLFSSVRMTLQEDNFARESALLDDGDSNHEAVDADCHTELDFEGIELKGKHLSVDDIKDGLTAVDITSTITDQKDYDEEKNLQMNSSLHSGVAVDDVIDSNAAPTANNATVRRISTTSSQGAAQFIRLPIPGPPTQTVMTVPTDNFKRKQHHLVPSCCAICLTNYEVGDDVVWSSNPACDHAFHGECIEQWLMRLRGELLCPCCRQEFVIDPYDTEDQSKDVINNDEESPTSNPSVPADDADFSL